MLELKIKQNKTLVEFLKFSVKNPNLGEYLDKIKDLFSRDLINLRELSDLLTNLKTSKSFLKQKKLIKKITN